MEAPRLEYVGTWEEIAMHATEFHGRKLRLLVMPDDQPSHDSGVTVVSSARTPTARELFQMSGDERQRILEQQIADAEALYRSVSDLTDFEACDTEDLFDATE
jgi:hypothetical protein